MNNKEIKEKINTITDLCLKAKELGHDCFFDFSAHVNQFSIRVYLLGWKDGKDYDYDNKLYLDEGLDELNLNETINYLEKLIFCEDREIILQKYKNKFDSIMEIDKRNFRDYQLSELMTNMEDVFSIPSYNDETFNSENPDVIGLYKAISNSRSFVKNLKAV